jgi:hypothetical protein
MAALALRSIFVGVLVAAASCGPAGPTTPTITQGFYGFAMIYDDSGKGPFVQPITNGVIAVYTPASSAPGDFALLASQQVAANGFYQVSLPPGSYCLLFSENAPQQMLAAPAACTPVTISGLERCDFGSGSVEGGGYWANENGGSC